MQILACKRKSYQELVENSDLYNIVKVKASSSMMRLVHFLGLIILLSSCGEICMSCKVLDGGGEVVEWCKFSVSDKDSGCKDFVISEAKRLGLDWECNYRLCGEE